MRYNLGQPINILGASLAVHKDNVPAAVLVVPCDSPYLMKQQVVRLFNFSLCHLLRRQVQIEPAVRKETIFKFVGGV